MPLPRSAPTRSPSVPEPGFPIAGVEGETGAEGERGWAEASLVAPAT